MFVTPEHGRSGGLEPHWGPFCDCDPGRHAGRSEPIFPSGMEQGSELFCCLEPENLVRGWSFSLENVPPVHTLHLPRLQGELLNAGVPLGPNTPPPRLAIGGAHPFSVFSPLCFLRITYRAY